MMSGKETYAVKHQNKTFGGLCLTPESSPVGCTLHGGEEAVVVDGAAGVASGIVDKAAVGARQLAVGVGVHDAAAAGHGVVDERGVLEVQHAALDVEGAACAADARKRRSA